MRRVLQMLRGLGITLGVALWGLLAGVLVFTGWVLGTQGGARWTIDLVSRTGLLDLQVGRVEGRLLGPLEVHDVVLELKALRLDLDRARLDWAPGALLYGVVRVAELSGGQLRLSLRDTPPDPDDDAPPALPELPVAIDVALAHLQRLELSFAPAEPPVPSQVIEQVRIEDARWIGERLSVARLAAQHALGRFEAQARTRLARHAVHVEALHLQRLDATPMQVQAQGLVQLDPAQDSDLQLEWNDLRWPLEGQTPLVSSGEGEVRIQGRFEGALRAQARFALGEQARVHADARWESQSLAATLEWTDLGWPLIGAPRISSRSGKATLDGSLEAWRYTLDAQLAAEGQAGKAQAGGTGGTDHVVVERLRLAVARAVIEGQGRVAWDPDLVADADLRVQNLDPGLIVADWPGRLNGRVQARTQLQGEVPRVRFEVALKDSRLRGYPLSLEARGEAEGATVTLDRAQLATGSTRVQASGRVTPPFDARAQLDSPDLAALWPGLGGRAQLEARLRGALEAPQVQARGQVTALGYEDLHVERVQLDTDVDLAGPWSLALDLRGLHGPAEVRTAQLRLEGSDQDHRLHVEVDAEPARAELDLRGALDRARRAWSGALSSGSIEPAGFARWTLEEPAALRASATRVQLEPACWRAPDSRLCLQGLRDAERLRGAFRLEHFDFAYFRNFLPAGWALTGGVDGSGMVELRDGRLSEARADLKTDPLQIQRDGERLLSAEAGTLQLEEVDGRAVALLQLPLQSGEIRFDGTLEPGAGDFSSRPLRGELRVRLHDLSFLRLFSEELLQISGKLDGQMNWSGTLQRPLPQGEVKLTEGGLRLATPNLDVQALQARIGTGSSPSTLDLSASATSGGGTLEMRGSADLGADPLSLSLSIRGKEFQAANMAEARAWVSPNLELRVAQRIELRGDVEVPRAEITPLSFDGGVGPSSDQVIVQPGDAQAAVEGTRALFADVRLVLGDKVRFEGFGLKTRLEGAVRAIEEPGRPGSGRGEVRLIEGRYKAYGQDLLIENGRLLFNGGPLTEPAIEIRAVRRPTDEIEVGVLARGTLDKPEFQLFSTPAMPRERQLSWLVLGRSLDQGGSTDERTMLASAALSLGLGGTDFLAQGLRGGLGLDDVSIGAEPGAQAEEARFTVGKYLSPKLYVSYGVGIFQPGQVFKILYDLGRGFKVSTESGVHAGGDLLYSVER